MNDLISFDRIDKDGPQTYRGRYDVSASDIARDEVSDVGSIDIDARVDKGDGPGEYVVDGTARFTADLTCSRCVEPYPFAHTSSFHVRFRPRPEAPGEGEEEVEITNAEELDVEFYGEREIPLRDLALEQVQLSIPMKPLCDDDCLGLCAVCGANRARERCLCQTTAVDERWEALQGLRDQLKKKES
jgi:uncharacterized protein